MTTALDMIRGRSNIVTLTNNSGGGLVAGDVCVQDTAGDEYVTTTTSAASTSKVFIAAETIASGASGKFYESGYCPLVNVNASVTRGRFLFTHTVAKQAAENATYGSGAFGRILKSGTTPSAIIYSSTAQISGGGVTRSGSTTNGNLAVWNGSSADSIKDGGVPFTEGSLTDYSSSSTVVGWSSFTTKEIFYKQTGKLVHVIYNLQGTSNANNVTFTLPLAAVANPAINAWPTWASDNSTNTIGYGTLAGSASTVTINKDPNATAWNTSGSKYAIGEFFYVTS